VRGTLEQPVAGFHPGSGRVANGDGDADTGAGGVVEDIDLYRGVVAQPQAACAGVGGDLFSCLLHDGVELSRVQDLADAVVVDGDAIDRGQGYPSMWARLAS
jgi:hypothetical protein